MADRTRTPALLSAIVTALVLMSAAGAWAQPTPKKELPVRHVDVEAGIGVHFALENDGPVDDDVYAPLGLAIPVTDHVDGEFQAAYWSGSQNPRRLAPGDDPQSSLDGWHFNAGFRYYPGSKPDSTARFYLAAGTSLLLDWNEKDDWTVAANLGPGVRMRAGDRSGLLLRVPVLLMMEGDINPVMIPSLSYFFQF
jgi:hypothetical protein